MIKNKQKDLLSPKVVTLLVSISVLPVLLSFFPISVDQFGGESGHSIIHNVFDLSLLFLGVTALVFSILNFIIDKTDFIFLFIKFKFKNG